jgi:hypothetical protein
MGNISRLSQYRSKPMEEMSEYSVAPYNHGAYDWISQDGTRTNIQELDDNHLINIYKILVKSILMAKDDIRIYQDTLPVLTGNNEINMDVALSDTMDSLDELNTQIKYIGHELYRRGVLVNKFDKYEEISC